MLAARLSELFNLKVRRLYTDGKFVPKAKHICINWGSSENPQWLAKGQPGRVVNPFEKIRIASNKLNTFELLKAAGNVPIPEFTTDRNVAESWVTGGGIAVARTVLNGHSGKGIIIVDSLDKMPENCPLFVKYMKKKHEYRVHVAFGKVIDVQAKRKRRDYDGDVDTLVRNHHTGWVYCREDVEISEEGRNAALNAVVALGLDFGAVDLIFNEHYNQFTVLEVNTAPGLEGQSVENYAQTFYEALK